MTETTEKPWYKDGCFVVFIVFVAVIALLVLLNPKQKHVYVQLHGRIQQGVFAASSFELACSHQFPGDLRNGTLSVWVRGKAITPGKEYRLHSFETWRPNKENAVSFSFPLTDYSPDDPLVVEYLVQPANGRDSRGRFVWQNGDWNE